MSKAAAPNSIATAMLKKPTIAIVPNRRNIAIHPSLPNPVVVEQAVVITVLPDSGCIPPSESSPVNVTAYNPQVTGNVQDISAELPSTVVLQTGVTFASLLPSNVREVRVLLVSLPIQRTILVIFEYEHVPIIEPVKSIGTDPAVPTVNVR